MPVISALTFFKTESTIVATWTTDVSADSNLSAGGKAAVDNGYAANSTSHQCVVTGLSPNTSYSCVVTSGGTSSIPQNVKTLPQYNRIPILSATGTGATTCAFAAPGGGDSLYTFVSSDNITYCTMNDGFGFSGVNNAGANFQLGKITNESTFAGANVNIMSSYLGQATQDGSDGPGGIALRGACHSIFGLNGHLFLGLARGDNAGTFLGMGNVIRDNGDHGASWNRFDIPSSFAANGQGPADGKFEFAQNTYADLKFVRYGADDGTLGYNASGNQIDGANAYVYIAFKVNATSSTTYLMRWPRIKFDASDNSGVQYWIGTVGSSTAPADFVNDANWSSSDTNKTSILTTAFNSYDPSISFIAGLNRYMLTYFTGITHGTAVWHFFEAPTPAGPWTEFYTANTAPLGWIAPMPMHRDCFTNTLTDVVPIRLLFAGDLTIPADYQGHFATLYLRTTPSNTFVQATGTTTAQTSATPNLAFSSNVTAGNLLVAALRDGGPHHSVSSVSDNMGVGNLWTVVYDSIMPGGSDVAAAWAYTFSKGSGPCTVTFNLSASTAGCVVVLGEWRGPNTVRATPGASLLTTQTALTSNSANVTGGDLLLGLFHITNGSPTAVAGTTPVGDQFTIRASGTSSGTFYLFVEDVLNANPGTALTANATISGTQNGTASGFGVFFTSEFSISGSTGVAGALVSYSGTASGSVIADGSGNYTIPNLIPGSYTITPSASGYVFAPFSSNQTISSSNISGVNFTASPNSGTTQLWLRRRRD